MLQGADATHFKIEDYTVTFVYTDGDGDSILIDSPSGLLIAMEEAESKLKVIANVKKIVPVAKQNSANKISAKAPANKNGVDKTDYVVVVNKNHPFIHGSQVCAGCNDHPIIGKRWYGVREDGSDLNLCEKCNDTYTGDEKLEAVEHGRLHHVV